MLMFRFVVKFFTIFIFMIPVVWGSTHIPLRKAWGQPYFLVGKTPSDNDFFPITPPPMPSNWNDTIQSFLESDSLRAITALTLGEGVGGIRKKPMTREEMVVFFNLLFKATQTLRGRDLRNDFLRIFLHPFMFTKEQNSEQLSHSILCAALAKTIFANFRHPERSAEEIFEHLVDQLKTQATYQVVYSGSTSFKTFQELFQENTKFKSFDDFLTEEKIAEKFAILHGEMKKFLTSQELNQKFWGHRRRPFAMREPTGDDATSPPPHGCHHGKHPHCHPHVGRHWHKGGRRYHHSQGMTSDEVDSDDLKPDAGPFDGAPIDFIPPPHHYHHRHGHPDQPMGAFMPRPPHMHHHHRGHKEHRKGHPPVRGFSSDIYYPQ